MTLLCPYHDLQPRGQYKSRPEAAWGDVGRCSWQHDVTEVTTRKWWNCDCILQLLTVMGLIGTSSMVGGVWRHWWYFELEIWILNIEYCIRRSRSLYWYDRSVSKIAREWFQSKRVWLGQKSSSMPPFEAFWAKTDMKCIREQGGVSAYEWSTEIPPKSPFIETHRWWFIQDRYRQLMM